MTVTVTAALAPAAVGALMLTVAAGRPRSSTMSANTMGRSVAQAAAVSACSNREQGRWGRGQNAPASAYASGTGRVTVVEATALGTASAHAPCGVLRQSQNLCFIKTVDRS
jgi:hypothetical protein